MVNEFELLHRKNLFRVEEMLYDNDMQLKNKIDLLEIRDDLDKKVSSGIRTRDSEKRFLLAKEKKESELKKVGDRKYKYL